MDSIMYTGVVRRTARPLGPSVASWVSRELESGMSHEWGLAGHSDRGQDQDRQASNLEARTDREEIYI